MKYYLIAGEASGDLHGANLMRALRTQDTQAQFRFWGGDRMAEVGGVPFRHISQLAFMGFVEVVTHLSTVLGNIRLCKRDILEFHPDVIIYIDYPGFNLRMARFAKRHGFRNLHYISPQLWAWKKGRIKTMRRNLDSLCYILPFEQQFYAHNRLPQALYVGHPLLDAVQQFRNSQPDVQQQAHGGVVALLPGSRRQEVSRMLPLMVQLAQRMPEQHFEVAGMSLLGADVYSPYISGVPNITIVYDQTYPLLARATAAVVCSGTATLEAALFDVPQVVCYRANAFSVALARMFVGHRVRYISLVNLIADAPVVTELIQDDCNLRRLNEELVPLVTDTDRRRQMLAHYAQLRHVLGDAGASARTATEAIRLAHS